MLFLIVKHILISKTPWVTTKCCQITIVFILFKEKGLWNDLTLCEKLKLISGYEESVREIVLMALNMAEMISQIFQSSLWGQQICHIPKTSFNKWFTNDLATIEVIVVEGLELTIILLLPKVASCTAFLTITFRETDMLWGKSIH